MKILVLGDPHGSVPAIDTAIFDAIICTGDFVPDATLRQIIFRALAQGRNWRDMIRPSKLKQILKRDYASGMNVLGWLGRQHKPVFFIPGNWDVMEKPLTPFYEGKLKKYKNLVDCDEKLIVLEDFCIIGYGKTAGPEMREQYADSQSKKEDRHKFEVKQKQLSKLFLRARALKKPVIFLIHNPPFNTKLDKVNNRTSPAHGKHVGSQISAQLISRFKPALCICGHMHENTGSIMINKTLCINAGCLHETKKKVFCIEMPKLHK